MNGSLSLRHCITVRATPILRTCVPFRFLAPTCSLILRSRLFGPFDSSVRHHKVTLVTLSDSKDTAVVLRAFNIPCLVCKEALVTVVLCNRPLIDKICRYGAIRCVECINLRVADQLSWFRTGLNEIRSASLDLRDREGAYPCICSSRCCEATPGEALF